MAKNLKIGSLNVRGLNNDDKRNAIFRWVQDNKYDICCFQETYYTKSNHVKLSKGWSGISFHSFSNSAHSRGVSVLLSKNLNASVISSHSDNFGRIVLVNIKIENRIYSVVSLYAPNDVHGRIMFYKQLLTFVNMHAISMNRLIIAGDFNCKLTERDSNSGILDRSRNILKDVMSKLNVKDIWRSLNPDMLDFTYIDPSNRVRNSRIDYIMCSTALVNLCYNSAICQSPAPDHKVVNVHIKTM